MTSTQKASDWHTSPSMPHDQRTTCLPWVEKYRPKRLTEVVGNAAVVEAFRRFVQERAFPNLILAGPPGVGKTTCLECLAREMWGKSGKDYILSMNASDDRGVQVVRESIVHFARTKRPSEDIVKLVILDEADSMTGAAQQSLRRVMENYSETTRFAFAANDPSKLIEAIQSRCAVFHFGRLRDDDICKRLVAVCQNEGIQYDAAGLAAIVFTADGDMRPALNNLQATYAGFGKITEQNVYSICDIPHPSTITKVVRDCMISDFYTANRLFMQLYEKGHASEDLVKTMIRVIKNLDMDEELKIKYLQNCAITHMRVLDGLTGKLQLASLLGRLCQSAEHGNSDGTSHF